MSITSFFKKLPPTPAAGAASVSVAVSPGKKAASRKAPDEEVEVGASPKRAKVAVAASPVAGDATPSWNTLESLLPPDWAELLADEIKKPYFGKLKKNLASEAAAGKKIFPPLPLVFNALKLCPVKQCKVVVIGTS
jgi:hypothetical protein